MSGVALVRPARRISASICRRLPREACLQPGLRPTTVITPQRYHRNNSSRSRRSGGWDSMPLAPGASILLTVALCSVSADSPAEAGWWPFSNRQPASPFSNTIPRKAKKQRAKAEVQMRKYLAKMRKPVQELMTGLRKGEVRFRGEISYTPWTGFYPLLLYHTTAGESSGAESGGVGTVPLKAPREHIGLWHSLRRAVIVL